MATKKAKTKKKVPTHLVMTYPEYNEFEVAYSEEEACDIAREYGTGVQVFSINQEYKVKIELIKV